MTFRFKNDKNPALKILYPDSHIYFDEMLLIINIQPVKNYDLFSVFKEVFEKEEKVNTIDYSIKIKSDLLLYSVRDASRFYSFY